ncbi:aspartate aminotransferase family protein [Vibrio profundum]|uniref:pyridoxal phosphate-dependent decarboxylase family protein n=1 Tax=Vibrio profundum TaxID=2910247 RepID=UPI003D11C162
MNSADSLRRICCSQHEANNPSDFLFNQDNLPEYKASLKLGAKLITQRIQNIHQPFTGILPNELAENFDHIELNTPLSSLNKALEEVDNLYLKDAIYFHHPKYMAHLNCPVVYPAILAEQILSSVNSSLDTWDQSAGGTLIEQKLINWTAEKIGYSEKADGIFTSGGTQSNLMALLLARDNYCAQSGQHNIREQGLPAYSHKFRIFTSELSHFSIQKSAALLGLGYQAVISISSNDCFQMDVAALTKAVVETLNEGLIPLMVVATTGTTDFGSIDPIDGIAEVCKKYNVWMHADAAYGGGTLVSKKHRDKLANIHKADSVTVDYHKSFFQPVSCGAFFVKDRRKLALITHHAEYLNPLSQRQEGTPNLVDKSLQTTRRFDSLKLWLTLRVMGADNIGQAFDSAIDLAKRTHQFFLNDPNIELLHQPELSTLIFRFVPSTPASDDHINKANEHIRKAIFRSGEAVIASTQVQGKRYLKFTLLNPATTLKDIDEVRVLIKRFGRQYFTSRVSPQSSQSYSQPSQSHSEPVRMEA